MNILVVDDDQDLRETLALLLDLKGYPTLQASSGNEAIRLMNSGKPISLVISDYYMQDGDGMVVLKHINSLSAAKPVFILITGQSAIDAEAAKKLGAQEFFLKPFDIVKLLDTVHALYKK